MSNTRCPQTGYACSTSYSRGCRCDACRAHKAKINLKDREKKRAYNVQYYARNKGSSALLRSRRRAQASEKYKEYHARYDRARRDTPPKWARRAVSAARARSKKKGLPVPTITPEEVVGLVVDRCPVLEIPLAYGNNKRSDNSASLDRIVPDLGYIKGNVRIISLRANRILFNATPEELRACADWREKVRRVVLSSVAA